MSTDWTPPTQDKPAPLPPPPAAPPRHGMSTEQEIRARAVALAIDALARVDPAYLPTPDYSNPRAYVLDVAEVAAAYIQDGSTP